MKNENEENGWSEEISALSILRSRKHQWNEEIESNVFRQWRQYSSEIWYLKEGENWRPPVISWLMKMTRQLAKAWRQYRLALSAKTIKYQLNLAAWKLEKRWKLFNIGENKKRNGENNNGNQLRRKHNQRKWLMKASVAAATISNNGYEASYQWRAAEAAWRKWRRQRRGENTGESEMWKWK